jgi:hypothetical protein
VSGEDSFGGAEGDAASSGGSSEFSEKHNSEKRDSEKHGSEEEEEEMTFGEAVFSLAAAVAAEVFIFLYGGSMVSYLVKFFGEFLAGFVVRLSVVGDVLVLVALFAATGGYTVYKWFRKKSLGGNE